MKNIASCIKTRIALSVLMLMALLPASAQYKMVVHTNNGTSTEFWASSVDSVTWVYSEPESSGNDEDEATVTGDASNITAYSATISSWANILDNLSSDIKIGIIYTTTGTPSKSNGTQETVSLSSLDKNAQYSLTLNNLAPSTTYYYRSFVYLSGLWFYGKVKSFTTKEDNVVVTGSFNEEDCTVKSELKIGAGAYSSLKLGVCYGTTETPTVKDHTETANEVDDENNYIVTLNLTYIPLGTTVYYRSYVKIDGVVHYGEVKSFVKEYKVPVGEYVDLGLSVKWATFNVGATKPEEYGDYFAWGETEPKSEYDWSTYKYCKGSCETLTKYCYDSDYGYNGFTDNKIVLDLEDDAAHVNWGGSWRMPTKEEQDELRNNCTWTWYDEGNLEFNGVAGYKVQSKKDGYTAEWVFLPATGYRGGSGLNDVGYGYYWLSSLRTDYSGDAYYLDFGSGYVDWGYGFVYRGRSVRPVCP